MAYNKEATEELLKYNFETIPLVNIKELVNRGADINVYNKDGYTLLFDAVFKNDLDKVKKLLNMGADPNIATKKSQTPLIYASKIGYTDIVDALLSKDVDVNAKNIVGDTALIESAYYGHTEIVKMLLAHKDIDVNVKSDGGKSAMDYAAERGNKDIIRAFLLAERITNKIPEAEIEQEPPQPAEIKVSELKEVDKSSRQEGELTALRIVITVNKMKKGEIETTPESVCDLLSRTRNEGAIERITEYVDEVSANDKKAYEPYYKALKEKEPEINRLPFCNFVSNIR